MSAEDNTAAEPAEIGEALVAALGFEPTEGKKLGRRVGSSASIVDELSEAENTIVDNTNDAPSVDDAFSVISTDSEVQDGEEASSAGDGSGSSRSANGGTKAPAKKANKSNRQRSRNRKNRNNGQRNNQRSGGGSGSGSANSKQKAESKPEAKPSLDEIKSAAKPTVSGAEAAVDDAVADAVDGSVDAAASAVEETKAGAGSKAAETISDASSKLDDAKDADAAGVVGAVGDPVAKAKAETEAIRQRLADAKRKAGIDADTDTGAKSGGGASPSKSGSGSGDAADSSRSESTSGKDNNNSADKVSKTAAGESRRKADETKLDETKANEKKAPASGTGGDRKANSSGGAATAGAVAAGAAVTGEMMAIDAEIGSIPPPPSAADAIQVEEVLPAVAEAVPTSPPTKAPDQSRVDGTAQESAKADARPKGAPTTLEADTIAVPVSPPTEGLRPKLKPMPAVLGQTSWPSLGELPFPNPFRRKRRVQARKVRRVVRHVDPWSVLTFSVLFHLCVFAALLLASVLVWNAAEAAGTIENMETFITDLGDYESFEIKGDVVFKSAVAIAGILTLASSVLLVLLTVVFNLISDLVGGIRLTVIEEETVRVRRKA